MILIQVQLQSVVEFELGAIAIVGNFNSGAIAIVVEFELGAIAIGS